METRIPSTQRHDYRSAPVGGRLQFFSTPWFNPVFRCLGTRGSQGSIQNRTNFIPTPQICDFPSQHKRGKAEETLEAIQQLLKSQAIEIVPAPEQGQGLYLLLFTVPKKNGKWRAVLDLKFLNEFVAQKHFRMETLQSIAEALQPQEFFTSIDLTDAYLHIPIFLAHCRFLHFCIGGHH